LTRIDYICDVEDYNLEFLVLATRVDDISDQHLLESYMGGLKDDIKHDIFLKQPKYVMETMQFSRNIQVKNKATTSLPME